MRHALVLNTSFEPLNIVSWQRAVQLLFQGKVEVIEEFPQEIRTVRLTLKMPAVLRLHKYVSLAKKKQLIRFSRANIFVRDQQTCQYCGGKFPKSYLTLDHVIPVVQGGKKSWENIVTACKPCNQQKGGRTPHQANLSLIGKPKCPNWLPQLTVHLGAGSTPEEWKIYFGLGQKSAVSSPDE